MKRVLVPTARPDVKPPLLIAVMTVIVAMLPANAAVTVVIVVVRALAVTVIGPYGAVITDLIYIR